MGHVHNYLALRFGVPESADVQNPRENRHLTRSLKGQLLKMGQSIRLQSRRETLSAGQKTKIAMNRKLIPCQSEKLAMGSDLPHSSLQHSARLHHSRPIRFALLLTA